jgi:hypothetical protein
MSRGAVSLLFSLAGFDTRAILATNSSPFGVAQIRSAFNRHFLFVELLIGDELVIVILLIDHFLDNGLTMAARFDLHVAVVEGGLLNRRPADVARGYFVNLLS